MGRYGGTGGGGRYASATGSGLENQIEQLRGISQSAGLEEKKPSKFLSAVQKVGRVLNIGTATVAGAVRGAIRKDQNVFEGIREGVKKNIGFGDVLREDIFTGIEPQNKFQEIAKKVMIGAVGFAADVLFDPLTYLTFGVGAGLKVGGKTLTKGATKLAQKASAEVIAEQARKLTGKMTGTQLAKESSRGASGIVNELLLRAGGKKGITSEVAEEFISKGVSKGTVDDLLALGKGIYDAGGIKFFGKTLVTSNALAKTPVGKAARALGEVEVVKALGNTLGKMFVPDFMKNPRLTNIIDKAGFAQRRALQGILKSNEKLFKDLSDDEMTTLFNTIWEKKASIAKTTDDIPGIIATMSNDEIKELVGPILGPDAPIFRKGILTQTGKDALEKILRDEAKFTQKSERLIFDNPKLQDVADKLFEGDNSIVKRFAKLANIPEEEAIKFYIPSKFADKIKVKEFAIGKRLGSPTTGFQKKFTGVEEGLIKDPFEAYSRGQVEIATSRIRGDAVNSTIRTFGKSLKEMTEQEAKRLGYKKISIDGVKGKIEGWLPENIHKEMTEFITPKDGVINDLARLSGFDWATGLFKGYVTSLFPGFHIRNVTSNQFQNMLKIGIDVANPSIQKNAWDIVLGKNLDDLITTKTGKQISKKDLMEQIRKESDILDNIDVGAFGKMETFEREAFSRTSKGKFNPFSRNNILVRTGQKIGLTAEKQAKLVNILSAVAEGKSVKEGVKQAEEALFNYSKLTNFEKDVMRRLIPFYTFARKNIELQVRALASTPGRVAAQFKFIKNAGNIAGGSITEKDKEGLPSYILDSLGIKAGTNQYGQNVFLTGFGLPIEEFLQRFSGKDGIVTNAFKNTLGQINPLLKFPLERATGVDFFRERPISELNNAQDLANIMNVMPAPVAKQLKELIEWREVKNQPIYANGKVVGTKSKYYANPFVLHLLRNMFTSRIQSTVGFLTDQEQTPLSRWLRGLSGVRSIAIDEETQRFFNLLEQKQELEKYLSQMGALGIKDIYYEKGVKKNSIKR
ncbi:MAG: hypothetical protein IPM48_14585 [Saprospiraceae bacterium]|nr:hypothetical protein [Saprospiraceae bacterium]